MLLANNRYTLTIRLDGQPYKLEFLSELDPLYIDVDEFVRDLGSFADGIEPIDIAVLLLQASCDADSVLGLGATDEEREEYVTLKSRLRVLESLYENFLMYPESVKLGDLSFSYGGSIALMRLIRGLKIKLSKYEGTGGITSVSKGERRTYPLAARW